MSVQSHRSDTRRLGRRTLERDHRPLAALLRPGHSVLDVGCGTGAIAAGIAIAVGPYGQVVGIDRDEVLLELAREQHSTIPNIRFDYGDITSLSLEEKFDIVTAARTLQWIDDPASAISNMKRAAKPSGVLVVLDYNHSLNKWDPDPPTEFKAFYNAFLAWREANGWDNEIANHLPYLFRSAGLADIGTTTQDEVVECREPNFTQQSGIWSEVIESVGGHFVRAGFMTALQLQKAHEVYVAWSRTELRKQTLSMRAVTGMAP